MSAQRNLFGQSEVIQQPDSATFDKPAGKQRQTYGMELAAKRRRDVLERARALATRIAQTKQDRCITADEVLEALIELGYKPEELGNAAGSLFKTKVWAATGQWRVSRRVSNHARRIMVWRLI